MNDETPTTSDQPSQPRAIVEYKSSVTKGGQDGYRVVATSDATDDDAERVIRIANKLRSAAVAELWPPVDPASIFPSAEGSE